MHGVDADAFLEQVNKKKPTTMTQLADIWYTSHGANYGRDQHYNDSRYHMLNYHATFTKGTVEFRLFQFDAPTADRRGGLHAGQLKSYIQLCLALSQMAKRIRNMRCGPGSCGWDSSEMSLRPQGTSLPDA